MAHVFAEQRKLFPILQKSAQLSSCSQSAMAEPVAQALADYTRSWMEKGMDWGGWMATVNAAKAGFARLINADVRDISAMSCVSDITSSVGSALDFVPGKNGIVVGDVDFPSMGQVWLAHERKGACVRFVATDPDYCIRTEAYRTAINDETALVSLAQVSYYNGFIQDIAAITEIAHQHDALVFVDAYQSAGSMRIDVQRDPIDLLASGAQKYLLGIPGIAFLYVRPGLAERLRPSNTGWFGRVNPFAFDIHQLDYADGAARFDTGTPSIASAFAARAGLDLLNSLDMDLVQNHLRNLSQVALDEARRCGLRSVSPSDLSCKSAITALHVGDAASVEQKLAREGFIVSARNDVIRIAPHFYNTEDEVAGAVRAVARLTGQGDFEQIQIG